MLVHCAKRQYVFCNNYLTDGALEAGVESQLRTLCVFKNSKNRSVPDHLATPLTLDNYTNMKEASCIVA